MELELESRTGVGCGEKNHERLGQRNGYRDPELRTRASTVEMRIPKLRVPTSRAFWGLGGWLRRRPPPWCRRPTTQGVSTRSVSESQAMWARSSGADRRHSGGKLEGIGLLKINGEKKCL